MEVIENSLIDSNGTPPMDNSQETAEERKLRRQKEQDEGAKQEALRQKERADKYESRLINESVKKTTENPNYLLELHEQDPDLAEKVTKSLTYNGKEINSFDEFQRLIQSSSKTPEITEDVMRKQFDLWFEEKRKHELYSSSGKVVDDKFASLNDEQREVAHAKYKLVVGDRKVTPDEAREISDMVTLTVKRDKKAIRDEAITKFGSNGLSGNYSAPSKSNETEWAREIAEASGLGFLYSNNN